MSTKQFTLNNSVEMPAVGFGVFQTPPEHTRSAVEAALACQIMIRQSSLRWMPRSGADDASAG